MLLFLLNRGFDFDILRGVRIIVVVVVVTIVVVADPAESSLILVSLTSVVATTIVSVSASGKIVFPLFSIRLWGGLPCM